jgi:hypothetical protein
MFIVKAIIIVQWQWQWQWWLLERQEWDAINERGVE